MLGGAFSGSALAALRVVVDDPTADLGELMARSLELL
jgi:hypothetical protein